MLLCCYAPTLKNVGLKQGRLIPRAARLGINITFKVGFIPTTLIFY